VYSFIDSFRDLPPGYALLAILLGIAPATVSVLVPVATLVALFAPQDRAERARLVLASLLDALRAFLRCRGGRL
jgi:hypothetical protein